jgi:hypothetical protein
MGGEDDGYNVLFPQEIGGPPLSDCSFRRHRRIGVGEVVVAGWFDDVPMKRLEIVMPDWARVISSFRGAVTYISLDK